MAKAYTFNLTWSERRHHDGLIFFNQYFTSYERAIFFPSIFTYFDIVFQRPYRTRTFNQRFFIESLIQANMIFEPDICIELKFHKN